MLKYLCTTLTFFVCLCGGFAGLAAVSDAPVIVERTVISNSETDVGEFYELNADCSPAGDIKVNISKAPKNGTAFSEDAVLVTNFPADNQRHACNLRKSQGVVLKYTSKEGYTGSELFDVEVIYPRGQLVKYHYVVKVK